MRRSRARCRVLSVWIHEAGELEATNPHTAETRPVGALPTSPFTLVVTIVPDRET